MTHGRVWLDQDICCDPGCGIQIGLWDEIYLTCLICSPGQNVGSHVQTHRPAWSTQEEFSSMVVKLQSTKTPEGWQLQLQNKQQLTY